MPARLLQDVTPSNISIVSFRVRLYRKPLASVPTTTFVASARHHPGAERGTTSAPVHAAFLPRCLHRHSDELRPRHGKVQPIADQQTLCVVRLIARDL
jgi:hypothetical protein